MDGSSRKLAEIDSWPQICTHPPSLNLNSPFSAFGTQCPLPSVHPPCRYQRQIAIDIERYGEHYKQLGRRVASVAPASMDEVLLAPVALVL